MATACAGSSTSAATPGASKGLCRAASAAAANIRRDEVAEKARARVLVLSAPIEHGTLSSAQQNAAVAKLLVPSTRIIESQLKTLRPDLPATQLHSFDVMISNVDYMARTGTDVRYPTRWARTYNDYYDASHSFFTFLQTACPSVKIPTISSLNNGWSD